MMPAAMPGTASPPHHAEEDGYQLWLRYAPVTDGGLRAEYRAAFASSYFPGAGETLDAARAELARGFEGLLGRSPSRSTALEHDGTLLVGSPTSHPVIAELAVDPEAGLAEPLRRAGSEGYVLRRLRVRGVAVTIVAAASALGVLYGCFALLNWLQAERPLDSLDVVSAPRIRRRLLNHWDNLDRTIERGYAGFSLWDWHKLPDYCDPRYVDYARANASIGINGAVLNNVNSHALVLSGAWLRKVAALATLFRPYGVKTYLSARFSAPMELGGLRTADPRDAGVIRWWQNKAQEIYELIPDFGGFLVKANSEGQPGPQDYGRSHAEGANLLAQALAPHGGVVLWRAFVYDHQVDVDRAKQAYLEFQPLDGTLLPNALLQVKNGPIDFQPREPYHPLFGAMPQTPLALEVQITQEYLGNATHWVYLGPLFREVLAADTYCQGPGSSVAHVVDGSLDGHVESAFSGVSNIGHERNWCGHPFAAANWYAFGRLAWDPDEDAGQIAEDWLRMTFSREATFVARARQLMLESREAVVDYMTPLGLHHIMAWDHHHGPGPWVDSGRADWTSPYYHRADAEGLGFDRTETGSRAIEQYPAPYRDQLARRETCPESLLLWFHHVPWEVQLGSGRCLWDELCWRYQRGVEQVRRMRSAWRQLTPHVDRARHDHVAQLLAIQEREARCWRDGCLLYFQTFSRRPLPPGVEPPERPLEEFVDFTEYYVPGIPERRFGQP